MNRRLLLFLAALGMSIHMAACTSGDKKDDVESASSDIQDLNDPSAKDDALLSDALPEDSLGGKTVDSEIAADNSATAPTEPPMVLPDNNNTALDAAMSGSTETPAPPSPSEMPTTPTDSLNSSSTISEAPAAPKVSAPLQKVATKPWKVGEDWFNGVYFARPGDTLKSISTTIYGENRTALLKKGNPTYKGRAPKPGDKVYYSSVKRPGDQDQILNYYEETGVSPEVYVAKDGDDLRKVSKKLLGYDNAWKETWASNAAIESKGAMTAGTEVRYWASAPTATAAAAAPAETAASTNAEASMPPPPQDMNTAPPAAEMPPPPPPAQAMNDLPPPPPPTEQMPPPPPPAEAMNDLPPPPPPSQAMNDIPPPPPIEHAPPAAAAKVSAGDEKAGMDEDTMMALGTVAVAAAGIAALLVMRRRRKQNALDAGLHDSTHVG